MENSAGANQPEMRYYLIDEGLYPHGLSGSLSGILFKLEHTKDTQQLMIHLEELIQLLKTMASSKQLSRDFATWITHVLEPVKQLELNLSQIEDLVEVKNMLQNRVKEWEKQIFQDGHLSGIEKGMNEGVIKGEARILIHLIETRFGKLLDSQKSIINTATPEQLESWAVRVLDAKSIDDIF